MRSWSSSLSPPPPGEVASMWDSWSRWIRPYLAYLLLAIGTALSLGHGGQSWPHRLGTLGLAALAGGWLLLTDSLIPRHLRENGWLVAVSFAGTLTLATVLMIRDILFVVFMLACYFHVLRVRPVPLAVLGLAVTSLLTNSLGVGGPVKALGENPFLWLTIVTVQTAAIAGGALVAAKVAEQNELRREALAQLEAAHEENAGLQRQLLAQARKAGILDERQRLSREIHDTLAQGLTGIITQLEAAGQSADWRRHVANAMALARENLTEARRSVGALRPAPLEGAQLPDALRAVADRWAERASVAVEFTETGSARPLHPEIEATLLRVTQEALSNVAKHADAVRVGLTLSYMEDQVRIDVRDDGKGFDASEPDGFGITGMRQRVLRLMGTLAVESEPGAGTAVSASLPALETP